MAFYSDPLRQRFARLLVSCRSGNGRPTFSEVEDQQAIILSRNRAKPPRLLIRNTDDNMQFAPRLTRARHTIDPC